MKIFASRRVFGIHAFHESNWVLHLGSKDIWSKYCGQVLNAHLVLVAVGLNLIKKPEKTKDSQS